MIVFYINTQKTTQIAPIAPSYKLSTCETACASGCLKPKSKCCNKYLKKGINCKRCPLTYNLKAVS